MGRKVSLILALAVALAIIASRAVAAPQALIYEQAGMFDQVRFGPDPTPRRYAMGDAGVAVFWGDDADVRLNPAFLGYAEGIRYGQGGDDFGLRTHQATLGHSGVGILSAGLPIHGIDAQSLDLHFTGTDAYGTTLSFDASDHVRSWGAGVSLGGVATAWARHEGRETPQVLRHADVAFGYLEDVESIRLGNASGRAFSRSVGLLTRGRIIAARTPIAGPITVDIAYGLSLHRYGDSWQSPLSQGAALRIAREMSPGMRARVPRWLAPALDPLISLSLAHDGVNRLGAPRGGVTGAELGLMHLLSVELGLVANAPPWGFAVSLPLLDIAEIRYAWASRPSALVAPTLTAWSVRVDPFAFFAPHATH